MLRFDHWQSLSGLEFAFKSKHRLKRLAITVQRFLSYFLTSKLQVGNGLFTGQAQQPAR